MSTNITALYSEIQSAILVIAYGDAAVECLALDAEQSKVCKLLDEAADKLDAAKKLVAESGKVDQPKTLHHLDTGTLFMYKWDLWTVMDGGDDDNIHARRVALLNVNNTGELMLRSDGSTDAQRAKSVENFNAYNEVMLGGHGIYWVI